MQKGILLTSTLLFISCSSHAPKDSLYLSQINQSKQGTGGNNEVYNLHLCFQKKIDRVKETCLKHFFPKEEQVTIYVAQNTLSYPIGSRDTNHNIRTFDLNGKEEFIIHANLTDISNGIHTNIKGAKIYQDEHKVTIKIDVKDIDKKVVLYKSTNEILIEYLIVK